MDRNTHFYPIQAISARGQSAVRLYEAIGTTYRIPPLALLWSKEAVVQFIKSLSTGRAKRSVPTVLYTQEDAPYGIQTSHADRKIVLGWNNDINPALSTLVIVFGSAGSRIAAGQIVGHMIMPPVEAYITVKVRGERWSFHTNRWRSLNGNKPPIAAHPRLCEVAWPVSRTSFRRDFPQFRELWSK